VGTIHAYVKNFFLDKIHISQIFESCWRTVNLTEARLFLEEIIMKNFIY